MRGVWVIRKVRILNLRYFCIFEDGRVDNRAQLELHFVILQHDFVVDIKVVGVNLLLPYFLGQVADGISFVLLLLLFVHVSLVLFNARVAYLLLVIFWHVTEMVVRYSVRFVIHVLLNNEVGRAIPFHCFVEFIFVFDKLEFTLPAPRVENVRLIVFEHFFLHDLYVRKPINQVLLIAHVSFVVDRRHAAAVPKRRSLWSARVEFLTVLIQMITNAAAEIVSCQHLSWSLVRRNNLERVLSAVAHERVHSSDLKAKQVTALILPVAYLVQGIKLNQWRRQERPPIIWKFRKHFTPLPPLLVFVVWLLTFEFVERWPERVAHGVGKLWVAAAHVLFDLWIVLSDLLRVPPVVATTIVHDSETKAKAPPFERLAAIETALHWLWRVARRSTVDQVELINLPKSIYTPTALIGWRSIVTSDYHLLKLTVLLDQTLVQLHSFVLQFGSSIFLDCLLLD